MIQKVLVLAKTDYRQTNEETGVITDGLSIEYIGDRIYEEGETYRKDGYYSFKESLTDSKLMDSIGEVPCVCEFTMSMKSNSKDRKPRLVVTGIKRIDDFKMPSGF